MGMSKITRNFQVTLPRDVRAAKNFHVGDEVVFILKENCVDLVKLDDRTIADAAGLWADTKESGVEYARRLRSEWKRRPRA